MTRPAVQPVVHVKDASQAFIQVLIARDAGADGAWLINHGIAHHALWDIYEKLRPKFPGFWIGLNFLDLDAFDALTWVDDTVNGLWADDAHVHDLRDLKQAEYVAKLAKYVKKHRPWSGKYFGCVAFKGQAPARDPASSAVRAIPYVDVVTTSGSSTGVSAPIEKISGMHAALAGVRPLAIASGITPENVGGYLPHVEFLMVSTGISRSFHELDPEKTRALVRRVQDSSR
jgi:hypothetical protein